MRRGREEGNALCVLIRSEYARGYVYVYVYIHAPTTTRQTCRVLSVIYFILFYFLLTCRVAKVFNSLITKKFAPVKKSV